MVHILWTLALNQDDHSSCPDHTGNNSNCGLIGFQTEPGKVTEPRTSYFYYNSMLLLVLTVDLQLTQDAPKSLLC